MSFVQGRPAYVLSVTTFALPISQMDMTFVDELLLVAAKKDLLLATARQNITRQVRAIILASTLNVIIEKFRMLRNKYIGARK